MNKTINILRWIAVIPLSWIAGFLMTFPWHWMLYVAFAHNGTLFGFIELPPRSDIAIETASYPGLIALTFVLTGYHIAPNHKFITSCLLGVLWIVSFVGLFFFGSSLSSAIEPSFGLRGILSLSGALLGIIVAWRWEKS